MSTFQDYCQLSVRQLEQDAGSNTGTIDGRYGSRLRSEASIWIAIIRRRHETKTARQLDFLGSRGDCLTASRGGKGQRTMPRLITAILIAPDCSSLRGEVNRRLTVVNESCGISIFRESVFERCSLRGRGFVDSL